MWMSSTYLFLAFFPVIKIVGMLPSSAADSELPGSITVAFGSMSGAVVSIILCLVNKLAPGSGLKAGTI